MKFYVDDQGHYLGGFDNTESPPSGATEAPEAPLDTDQVWNGTAWIWTTTFYVDDLGHYLGGFAGAEPPTGAIEIAEPPPHGTQVWNGRVWGPPVISQDQMDKDRVKQLIGQDVLSNQEVRELLGLIARFTVLR